MIIGQRELELQEKIRQAQLANSLPGAIEQDDINKFELDVEPMLDRIYNELLGHIHNDKDGTWVQDHLQERIMNELGASEFIKEISTRVHTQLHFSDLSEEDILEMASRAAELYANKLEDNWEKWNVKPVDSNMESIAQKLYDNLRTCLNIARQGGMKKHKERRRYIYPSPQPDGGVI